jgi:hypothetical protein
MDHDKVSVIPMALVRIELEGAAWDALINLDDEMMVALPKASAATFLSTIIKLGFGVLGLLITALAVLTIADLIFRSRRKQAGMKRIE